MKLTLRSARKLEKKIANKLSVAPEYFVVFSAYDKSTPVDEKLNKAQDDVRMSVLTALTLSQIRAKIRRDIQQLNERSGLNEFISERKQTLDAIAIWKTVTEVSDRSGKEPVSAEIIQGKLEAILAGTSTSSYSTRESVSSHAVSSDVSDEAKNAITTLENLVDCIDDDILALNTGSKLTLDDSAVSLLQQLGLV